MDAKPLKPKGYPNPLDENRLRHVLDSSGLFPEYFEGHKSRLEQKFVMLAVSGAFNSGYHALIEAGDWRSLAYLIPAIEWAMQNGERVVVSTNTTNLQEQLAEKDVPAILSALGVEARAAVMKGKSRYLCPLRLNDLRRSGLKTQDEVRLLTKILIWLPSALTGDGDELFTPAPGERAAFVRLSAQDPACSMSTCSATDCYLNLARRQAESAYVVTVNHALLLADIAMENRALPEYHYLVVGEAHHLEAAATDSLAYRVDRDELLHQLGDLLSTSGCRATGLLVAVTYYIGAFLPPSRSKIVWGMCDQPANDLTRMAYQVTDFFDRLLDFLADRGGGESSEYPQRTRITRSLRNEPGWIRVESTFMTLRTEMVAFASDLVGLLPISDEVIDVDTGIAGGSRKTLDALKARAQMAKRYTDEAIKQMTEVTVKPSEQRTYWIEVGVPPDYDHTHVTLNASLQQVGPFLRKFLWDTKKSVILTSATMRTATPSTKGERTFT